jgi:hypothetical protein
MDEICCVIAKEDPTVCQAAIQSGTGNQTITIGKRKRPGARSILQ